MDIIKYNNPTYPTLMEQAEIVEGFTSKTWIERYRGYGEFKFVAPISSGLRTKLPLGCFVSHTDTLDLMIVENHEISTEPGKEPDIIISGRGFESFLEHRVVGVNMTEGKVATDVDFIAAPDSPWWQVVQLVRSHIAGDRVLDPRDYVPYVLIATLIEQPDTAFLERRIKPGSLYARIMELLELNDVGLQVRRPTTTKFINLRVHDGKDLSDTISFSHERGEIERGDYLWSIKSEKTSAYVKGRWVQTRVNLPGVQYNRRIMFVDASDVDNHLTEAPTGVMLDYVEDLMRQRGLEALAATKNTAITKAEAATGHTSATYRQDYNIGDMVRVHGEFDTIAKMRVTEYVEIEDESGFVGSPTFLYVRPTTIDISTSILNDDPAGYWPFNETEGLVAVDRTPNGNDGVYGDETKVTLGVQGPAKDLAVRVLSEASPIVIPYAPILNTPETTHELWFREVGREGTTRDIMMCEEVVAGEAVGGYKLQIGWDNILRSYIHFGSGLSIAIGTKVKSYTWNHVVVIITQDKHSIWMNGAPIHSKTINGYAPATTNDLIIGSNQFGTITPFLGDIAHLAIYDDDLTRFQILSHYADAMSLINQGV